jgi:HD-GYP domain-containing protein (c-di-GMP phosphodiesterase class II)
LDCLNIGSLLHDIGKMSIPDSILFKPGPLTDAEWKIMQQHPDNACAWLEALDYLRPALDIPYCHHERWDGSGYPQGLAGEVIPLAARIFAVVDTWDAMLSDRPYRKALPPREVIAHIKSESGSHFDPKVVRAFLKLIAEHPDLQEELNNGHPGNLEID